jgi:hypothetical protein
MERRAGDAIGSLDDVQWAGYLEDEQPVGGGGLGSGG